MAIQNIAGREERWSSIMAIQNIAGREERQRLVPSRLQTLPPTRFLPNQSTNGRSCLPMALTSSVNRQQAQAVWHRTTRVIHNINNEIALNSFKGAFPGVATLNHNFQVCHQLSIAFVTLFLITHGVRFENILSW